MKKIICFIFLVSTMNLVFANQKVKVKDLGDSQCKSASFGLLCFDEYTTVRPRVPVSGGPLINIQIPNPYNKCKVSLKNIYYLWESGNIAPAHVYTSSKFQGKLYDYDYQKRRMKMEMKWTDEGLLNMGARIDDFTLKHKGNYKFDFSQYEMSPEMEGQYWYYNGSSRVIKKNLKCYAMMLFAH